MTEMLADIVHRHATQRGQNTAFFLYTPNGSVAISWLQYEQASSLLALQLSELALPPASVVGIMLADGPLSHIAFLACEKAGLIALGLSPRAGEHEFCHLMRHSQAKALITHELFGGASCQQRCDWLAPDNPQLTVLPENVFPMPGLQTANDLLSLDQLHPGRLRDADALFLLNSTSGTTGLPKCVMQNQSRWRYFHSLVIENSDIDADDIFMSLLPAPVGFGLWSSHFTPTLLGSPTVLQPKFSVEETLDAIETHKVTVLAAVSTQFIMLLNSPSFTQRDFSSLRILYTGGEAVPYNRAKAFEDTTGAKVLQFYGSNETGALSCTSISDSQSKRLNTAGKPIAAMQVRLLDKQDADVTAAGFGQPVCKGPALSLGYYRDNSANQSLHTQDGGFKTGDLASIDEDGYLTVCGREGDFIIRGGKNISGPAVEEACLQHPLIQQAAAIAMADDIFGERVCLFAAVENDQSLDLAELVRFLRDNGCSIENMPERLELLEQLPTSSGGKTAKAELKKILGRILESELQ